MLYDRTLIQIRERSFLDLLDLSLYVIRARPIVLGLTSLVGIAPWAALNYWLLSDESFPQLAWIALLILEVPWATAPLTLVLGDLMFGMPAKLPRIARTLLLGLPALILSQLIVRGLMLMVVIFYLIMPSQYAFCNEVILLERSSAFRQFKRSRTLSRGFEGELFMRWLGQLFLGATFALCFWVSATILSTTLIGNELTWYSPGMNDVGGLLFQTGIWIAVAFFGVYRFFSYIDRRIRLEGWELDLRLKAVARGLEARAG
jgi:hypothetical protein